MGSPLPLFYQKTFYYVSGLIYLVTDAIKPALVLSITTFLYVGAYGMKRCVAKMTDRRLLVLLAPQALLLANYTFTDWLVRGDVAEFSAIMIVPWLLWWCLTLIKDKRFSLWIVPILFLLVVSHTAIAMLGVPVAALAYLLYIFQVGWREGIASTYCKILLAVGLLSVLVAPLLWMWKVFYSEYDPSTKLMQGGLVPTETFRSAAGLFYDRRFVWLRDWHASTTQIDIGIWVPLFFAGIVGLVIVAKRIGQKRWGSIWVEAKSQTVGIFLVLVGLAFTFMQLRVSAFVYHRLDFLNFLQFSYRMLAYITPVGILTVVGLGDYLYNKKGISKNLLRVGAIGWISMFVLVSPIPHRFNFSFLSGQDFYANPSASHQTSMGIMGGGEYLPRVQNARGHELSKADTMAMYWGLQANAQQAQSLDPNVHCTFETLHPSFEPTSQNYNITCDGATDFALPANHTPSVRVMAQDTTGGIRTISSWRTPGDARIHVHVDSSFVVTVHTPTISMLWSR
jgi:hypothetical protein